MENELTPLQRMQAYQAVTDHMRGSSAAIPAPQPGGPMPSYVIRNAPAPMPIDIPFTFDDAPNVLGYSSSSYSELALDMVSLFEFCKKNSVKVDILTSVMNGEMSFGVSLSKVKWGLDEHHSAKTLRAALGAAGLALYEIDRRRNVVRA